MADAVSDLIAELKTLRKGRGLYVRQIGDRMGPMLTRVCGVVSDDGPAEIRDKLSKRLQSLAAELPQDLRLAVLAAFAIERDARLPFYQDRVRWVANRLRRDERTARRRIDEGIERLAELATARGIRGPAAEQIGPRWYIEEIRTALMAQLPVPEALEFRRIVSEQDDLGEIDLALSLTVPTGTPDRSAVRNLRVDVIYGGTLVARSREAVDRFGFALELPRPLGRFDKHEYGLRYRADDNRPMLPHYVCVLKGRCDLFDLRVRFDRSRPPRKVWRLAGAFQRDLDDPVGRGQVVELDTAGELHVQFSHLAPGLVYGVRWEY